VETTNLPLNCYVIYIGRDYLVISVTNCTCLTVITTYTPSFYEARLSLWEQHEFQVDPSEHNTINHRIYLV